MTAHILVYFVARFVIVLLVWKECRHHSLFSVALFDSLHYTADFNLLRSFEKPPTANSHLTIDERSDNPELFPMFPTRFFLQTALVPLSLNGQDGEWVPVKSGGTGVLCEWGEVPSALWLTKKSCKESPHPFLTPPYPFSSLHPHLSPHCG